MKVQRIWGPSNAKKKKVTLERKNNQWEERKAGTSGKADQGAESGSIPWHGTTGGGMAE